MIGSIYRIIHLHSNICYVGSTMDSVRNRWQGHKTAYSTYLKSEKDGIISIYPYFKQYGIDTFKCVLVKEYEVEDKNHLIAYEQLWINKFKSININRAFNPLSKNKLYQSYISKEYYEANRDIILQKQQEYHKTNEYKQKQQKYRKTDEYKQKQQEYQQEYREIDANRDKILQAQIKYNKTNKAKQKRQEYNNTDKAKQKRQEYRTTDEAKQKRQEYRATDEAKQKRQEYYQANKDKILKKQKEANKDKIKQYQKEYRERKKQLEAELEYEV